MWRGLARSEPTASIDYQHGRQSVENVQMKRGVSGDVQQGYQQRPAGYSGDLREAITGLITKDSYRGGDLRGSIEGRHHEPRDSGGGSSHSQEPVSQPFARDLRDIISGSNTRELRDSVIGPGGRDFGGARESVSSVRDLRDAITGSSQRSFRDNTNVNQKHRDDDFSRESSVIAHSRDNDRGYSPLDVDHGGLHMRDRSGSEHQRESGKGYGSKDSGNLGHYGKESGSGHFERDSRGNQLQDHDFDFLAKTLKKTVDPKLCWSMGVNSSELAGSQVSDYKKPYQANAGMPQPSYILENNRLMMNVNQNPVPHSMKPQNVANLATNSQLLPPSGLHVNLRANLYPGNDLMMINPLQNRNQGAVVSLAPVVMSTPLQIMEAATVNKNAGVALGGSFWDSLKKDGLLSYQKAPVKITLDANELDATDPVGEDFQMPSLPRKRSSLTRRSRSKSPVRRSRTSNRRNSEDLRKSPVRERRVRRSISPRQRSELSSERDSRQPRERSPRYYDRSSSASRKQSLSPRRERIRSRSPVEKSRYGRGRLQERSRRSKELSPHRIRERSRSPRVVRGLSPRRPRKESPRPVREISPRMVRDRPSRMSREVSPRMAREMSPRMVRERSPRMVRERSRIVREMSPHIERERSRMARETSPHRARDVSRGNSRFSHERSPRIVRRHSRERSPIGLRSSPDMRVRDVRYREESPLRHSSGYVRGRSPIHLREHTVEYVRRHSPRRTREYSPVPVRILSPEHYPLDPHRSHSPAPVRILSPERVRRYPLEPHKRTSPRSYRSSSPEIICSYPVKHIARSPVSRSSPSIASSHARGRGQSPSIRDIDSPIIDRRHSPQVAAGAFPQVPRRFSPEEDRESPRRSWDTRNQPHGRRKRRIRKRFKRQKLVTGSGQRSDSGSSRDLQNSSLECSQDTPIEQQRNSPIDLARETSPISLASNDDMEFGRRDKSPLFDEVSLSPRSTRAASPGTPTSDERHKVLLDDDLQRGCSPVSLADFPMEQNHEDRLSINLQRDLSPVSLEEHCLDRNSEGSVGDGRSKSPLSDASRGSLIVTDSIDVQDSPHTLGEREGEDLRVQLLRIREEKVELKLKKLEEESLETELRLQNLSPDILDYSPQRDTPSPLLDECEDERQSERFDRKF